MADFLTSAFYFLGACAIIFTGFVLLGLAVVVAHSVYQVITKPK